MTAIRSPGASPTDTVDILHGRRVVDPYRWLEKLDDPASRRWLAEQQAVTDAYLGSLPGQDRLRETLGRILVDQPTASPVKSAGTRRFRVGRIGDARWQVQVRESPGDEWRTVVRTDELSDRAVMRRWQPSPDGRHLAVRVGLGGAENVTPLAVVDVATGAVVESCALTRYSPVEWRADGRAFYYVRRHGDRPGAGVYLHRLGTDPATDELLLGGDDPIGRYHIVLWHDRWLLVSVRSGTSRTAQVMVADVVRGQAPRPLGIGGLSATGVLIEADGRILATSTERTEYGQLLVADPPHDGNRGGWRVLVPEAEPAVLAGVDHAGVGVAPRSSDRSGHTHRGHAAGAARRVGDPGDLPLPRRHSGSDDDTCAQGGPRPPAYTQADHPDLLRGIRDLRQAGIPAGRADLGALRRPDGDRGDPGRRGAGAAVAP